MFPSAGLGYRCPEAKSLQGTEMDTAASRENVFFPWDWTDSFSSISKSSCSFSAGGEKDVEMGREMRLPEMSRAGCFLLT